MSRLKAAEHILTAAEQWKHRCLLGERSLFTDRRLWTRENFEELETLFVENPDQSNVSFLVKLERQLAPGSPDAKCLWAEMTWVYRLIQGRWSMGPETKRNRIADIWRWSERELPEGHELLDDAVLGAGVVNPGTAYNTLAWKEFRFFVVAMLRWFSLERSELESLLDRSWGFASWLDDTELAAGRMVRHALLFLLFPDKFEPIFSNSGKRRIISQLHQGERLDTSNQVELDRALLTIRRRLEDEYPDEEVHFYEPPIKELWQSAPARPKPKKRTETGRAKGAGENGNKPNGTYSADDAHQDLFIDRTHFDRLLTSIESRKNLILQGPPGTGKTFIARRIAWCVIGRKDNGPSRWYSSTSRTPTKTSCRATDPPTRADSTIKDGVFHRFCERARANPDTPHVFIIDEINRGNLSRIFGELLMLIEADKRSEDYAVALIYSDKQFHVPENVYILGMMNTADRSLALVDYALRRRFAFETLEPAYGTAYGRIAFENYLTAKGADPDLVTRISDRMDKLNETIRNDKELGRGFQTGHSYFVPGKGDEPSEDWYKHVVDTQIAPLLREYWFDSPQNVEKEVARLLGDG